MSIPARLGWNGMITFAAVYYLVPRLWQRERLYSLRMVNWHFWLATVGSFSTPRACGWRGSPRA
jgi:cbb3-type cytochrome oxidase subunit 1